MLKCPVLVYLWGMKLIQKLVNKWIKEEMAMENHCCGHCYEAGFRKAREMAAEKVNHFMVAYGWEGKLMTTNEVFHSEKHEMPLGKALIDQLGEEEV